LAGLLRGNPERIRRLQGYLTELEEQEAQEHNDGDVGPAMSLTKSGPPLPR